MDIYTKNLKIFLIDKLKQNQKILLSKKNKLIIIIILKVLYAWDSKLNKTKGDNKGSIPNVICR